MGVCIYCTHTYIVFDSFTEKPIDPSLTGVHFKSLSESDFEHRLDMKYRKEPEVVYTLWTYFFGMTQKRFSLRDNTKSGITKSGEGEPKSGWLQAKFGWNQDEILVYSS